MISKIYQDLCTIYGAKYFKLKEVSEICELCEISKDKSLKLKKVNFLSEQNKIIQIDSENFFNAMLSSDKDDSGSRINYYGLKKVCDGLCITEKEGKIYIFLFEMKSTFNLSSVNNAKIQLYSSLIKVKILFGFLKIFTNENVVNSFILTDEISDEDVNKYYKISSRDFNSEINDSCDLKEYNLALKKYNLAKFAINKQIILHLKDYKFSEIPFKSEFLPNQLKIYSNQLKIDEGGSAIESICLDDWICA